MKLTRLFAAASVAMMAAPSAFADLTLYDQDFEGLDMMDPAALGNDGWTGFANVFDPMGGYLYGYGTFPAPNGGPGFSAIATGSGGMDQGLQYVNIYSDYNNMDHANGNYIDALVFQEQPVGTANVGETWTFEFDYLKNPTPTNGDGDSQTFAFVKVIKVSDMSFATLAEVELDTTAASTTVWMDGSLDLLIDPAFDGELVQFGFRSYSTNYNDTGRFYDNVEFSTPGGMPPSLSPYSQDFEGLSMADPAAISNEGFVVFANVTDPMGGYLYGYGTFPAPNGGGGFSELAGGSGGPNQGTQYLNIFSDYNNADHMNGNYIEALVFAEQTIGAVDVGSTWRWAFDYLKNNGPNGDGDSETFAFLKVLKTSDMSFATLAEVRFDSTGASDGAWARAAVQLLIDASYEGETLQYGFGSIATNYFDTGRFYDNLNLDILPNPGLGTPVCLGNPSSTGSGSDLVISGSTTVADNNMTLEVHGLPANQNGYFITSLAPGLIYNPGGSDGHICIGGGPLGRYAANVLNSGATGDVSLMIDLTMIPTNTVPMMAMPGETRYFQYWTRDLVMGVPTSNFSEAGCVTFN